MKIFRRDLRKEQTFFVTRVRMLSIVLAGAILAILIVTLHFARTAKPPEQPSIEPPVETFTEEPGPVVPPASPNDPCQLVPPDVLKSEKHGVPVRVDPWGRKATVIDKGTLMQVLERLKQVSDEDLKARVDNTVTWETFTDKKRRDWAKGRVCHFRGVLRRFEEIQGVNLREIAIAHLYEAQMQDNPGRWYTIYCYEKSTVEPTRSDPVEVTGVFYKLLQYSTKKTDPKTGEREMLVTPLIIARTIEVRTEFRKQKGMMERVGESTPEWVLALAVLAAGILVCAGIAFLLRRKPTSVPVVRRR